MRNKTKKTHKRKVWMLAVDGDDPAAELKFELDFQMSLTDRQRYRMMNRLVKAGQKLEMRNGYQTTSTVVIRS